MKNNENVQRMIDEATYTMKGWCERRGNYKETHVDRRKLVELTVFECCKILTSLEEKIQDDRKSEYAEGWAMGRKLGALQLHEHFGLQE